MPVTKHCIRCGATENLHQHHYAPRAIFNDADDWGTVTLCPNHHALWHSMMRLYYTRPVDVGMPDGEAYGGWVPPSEGGKRCPSVKQKTHRQNEGTTRSDKSTWKCVLLAGHDGMCEAKPSARQAKWNFEEELTVSEGAS